MNFYKINQKNGIEIVNNKNSLSFYTKNDKEIIRF